MPESCLSQVLSDAKEVGIFFREVNASDVAVYKIDDRRISDELLKELINRAAVRIEDNQGPEVLEQVISGSTSINTRAIHGDSRGRRSIWLTSSTNHTDRRVR